MLCERSQGQKKTCLGFHSSETLEIIETTNLCYSDKKLISGCLRLGMEWGLTAGGKEVLFQRDRNILKLDYSDGYTTL